MTSKVDLRIENRDTLHLKVTNALREAIIRGDFKPGQRLKQSELADALGVSRMPVREAFQKLESEGLIILEPHKGAIVKSIQVKDIEEIYALRAEFERLAVEQSVEGMTEEDLKVLTTIVETMETTEDADEFVQYNIDFHRQLIKRCQWERLNNFISTLWNGFPQQTPHLLSGQIEQSKKEHREILDAVLVRDKKKAASLVSEHIKRTGDKLVQSLKSDSK